MSLRIELNGLYASSVEAFADIIEETPMAIEGQARWQLVYNYVNGLIAEDSDSLEKDIRDLHMIRPHRDEGGRNHYSFHLMMQVVFLNMTYSSHLS